MTRGRCLRSFSTPALDRLIETYELGLSTDSRYPLGFHRHSLERWLRQALRERDRRMG